MAAAFHGCRDVVLAPETTLALDFAATRNSNAGNPRRYDLDLWIVVPRAVFVARVDHKLTILSYARAGKTAAAAQKRHTLLGPTPEYNMAATPEFDIAERTY
ncbi:MAG TPA: hypothetical protein VGG69_02545 [Rhizomicrobium sp.]